MLLELIVALFFKKNCLTIPTNTLGWMNVILLHSNQRHVSAIDVAIFRVLRTRTQIHL
jgi:hypothetical protein